MGMLSDAPTRVDLTCMQPQLHISNALRPVLARDFQASHGQACHPGLHLGVCIACPLALCGPECPVQDQESAEPP